MPDFGKDDSDYKKYADIVNFKWPKPDKLGWMTLSNRAKIFLPFAALKGLETGNEVRDYEEKSVELKIAENNDFMDYSD